MKGRPTKSGNREQRVGNGLRAGALMKGRPTKSGNVAARTVTVSPGPPR